MLLELVFTLFGYLPFAALTLLMSLEAMPDQSLFDDDDDAETERKLSIGIPRLAVGGLGVSFLRWPCRLLMVYSQSSSHEILQTLLLSKQMRLLLPVARRLG